MTSDNGKIAIRTEMKGIPLSPPEEVDAAKMRCSISVKQNGRTIVRRLAPAADEWIETDLGPLPPGDYELRLSLLDPQRRQILAETAEPLHVEPAATKTEPPAGACLIDERGRCIVDGKPFMPVGVYCYRLDRENIRRLAQGGFNFVAPYSLLSCDMDSGVDPNQASAEVKTSNLETVRTTLDECHRNGLKVSVPFPGTYWASTENDTQRFGVSGVHAVIAKTVESFKRHPGILAWYVADEPQPGVARIKTAPNRVETLDLGDFLRGIYRDVKAADPWHPVWTVFIGCTTPTQDYRSFMGIADVVAVDDYPIDARQNFEMGPINLYCDQLVNRFSGRHGAPLWAVPQMHNLGAYDSSLRNREELLAQHRYPTGDEMLGMAMMFAIHGAKGFVLYSYHDLFLRFSQPDFPRRWPEICLVVRTLNSLAPFIVSEVDGPAVEAEFSQGIGSAKGFADGKGNVRVLIAAGVRGGPQEATIKVRGAKVLKSCYGLTARNGDGSYHFVGKNICYDVLEGE